MAAHNRAPLGCFVLLGVMIWPALWMFFAMVNNGDLLLATIWSLLVTYVILVLLMLSVRA